MARRHRNILAKLDPIAVNRYQITEKDIRTIERYLKIIQRDLRFASTWQEIIDFDSAYATSMTIHEVVEIRLLQAKNPELLKLDTTGLADFLTANIQDHAVAIFEEHLYLQEYIARTYQQRFEVATLIRANRGNNFDLEIFLESDVGVYFFEAERVDEASQILAILKGETEQ